MSQHSTFGGRTLARSQALQLLFQAEATGRAVSDVLAGDYVLSDGPLEDYGEKLALGVDEKSRDLDLVISDVSSNWSVDRMPCVDKNLLRIALYEMLEVEDVADAVAISEAVVLAKAYGSDESSRFINGLLGKVSREIEAGDDPVELAREHRYGHAGEADEAGASSDAVSASVAADVSEAASDAETDGDAAGSEA